MKYTESLTRKELTNFVRFYLYRSTPFLVSLVFLVLTIALGVGTIMSGARELIILFVVYMTLLMICWVWAILAQFRTLKIYSQSQYPQEFDFTETALSVTCANGLVYLIPWRHVRQIHEGPSFVYFATSIGMFWVHKGRFTDHLLAVKALWKPQKSKGADRRRSPSQSLK